MIGASATYLLVNICCTLSKFFSESDKKICEFVSSNCAEQPVKSLPSRSLCCTKSVIKTSCMNETVLPLSPSKENLRAACHDIFSCRPEQDFTRIF
jgi:hypothetical protein